MDKVSSTFRKINLREVSLCVVAILAMCVSAVSACACTHHQPKPTAEEASCHSSSHVEISQAETEPSQSDSLDANCNCFINTPVSAIVSQTESKKIAAEKEQRNSDILVAAIRLVLVKPKQGPILFDAADLNYSNHLLVSGPSRAPPRL